MTQLADALLNPRRIALIGASGDATYTSSLDFSKQMACPTGTHFDHYLNGGHWDWDWNAPDSLTVTGSGAARVACSTASGLSTNATGAGLVSGTGGVAIG